MRLIGSKCAVLAGIAGIVLLVAGFPRIAAAGAPSYAISTVAGTPVPAADGAAALKVPIYAPQAVEVDSEGTLFVFEGSTGRIFSAGPDGILHVFATVTTPNAGYLKMRSDRQGGLYVADGYSQLVHITRARQTSVLAARLQIPAGVTVSPDGTVYFSEWYGHQVHKITPDGNAQLVAGNGSEGFGGDGGQAVSAQLKYPRSLALDTAGNLYIQNAGSGVRVVSPSGVITSLKVAGQTSFESINDLIVDSRATIFFVSGYDHRISSLSGAVFSIIGGNQSYAGFNGDGPALNTMVNEPNGIALDSEGNIYIADTGNCLIRRLSNGYIRTVAGNGHGAADGPANETFLNLPHAVGVDPKGTLYLSDGPVLRRIGADGKIKTVQDAGDEIIALATTATPGLVYCSTSAAIYRVTDGGDTTRLDKIVVLEPGAGLAAIAADRSGNLYYSLSGKNVVQKRSPDGTIATIAGTGAAGYAGDGAAATAAILSSPRGLAVDAAGNVYISDAGNMRVRRIDRAGVITTVMNRTWTTTLLVDDDGDIWSGGPNAVVLRFDGKSAFSSGMIVAGRTQNSTELKGYAGDGGNAAAALLNTVTGIAMDQAGALYIADWGNRNIRKLTPNPPALVEAYSGAQQSGSGNRQLPKPFVARVLGAPGLLAVGAPGIPTGNVAVKFGWSNGSYTATTDNDGLASMWFTPGSTPGNYQITAAVEGLAPVSFAYEVLPAAPTPAIAPGGVVGAGFSIPAVHNITPNGYVTVLGSNFTSSETGVAAPAGPLPDLLAGTCVLVSGVRAPLSYVSPTQINLIVPNARGGTGTVQVVAACENGPNKGVPSSAEPVMITQTAPEFLFWDHAADGINPVLAVNAVSGAYVGPPGVQIGTPLTPAKAGDILTIYMIGLGPTDPTAAPGSMPELPASLKTAPLVFLGGRTLSSEVLYAGGSGAPGLYQLNIVVPAMAAGRQPLVVYVNGYRTPDGAYLEIEH